MVALLVISVLPTIVFMIYIYVKDAYEKEPISLLLQLFFLGVASIIPAIIFEEINGAILGLLLTENTVVYHFFDAFIGVALVEEGFKFLFTYVRTWKSKNYNYKFDGIVYAVFVSLGFATLENILYVFTNGFGTGIMRAFLAVPGHVIDAIFMGYFYGLAKQSSAKGKKGDTGLYLVLSLLVAITLHGFYDFCLMAGGLWIIAFLIFVVAMDALGIIRVHNSSKHDEALFRNNYMNVYGNVYVPMGYQVPNNMMQNGMPMQNNMAMNGMPMQNNMAMNGMNQKPMQYNSVIRGRTDERKIYCAYCGSVNNMKSFYCLKCGKGLLK